MTELLKSLMNCDVKQVKLLLEKKCTVNSPISNTGGLTALHVAAGIDSPDRDHLVSFLLHLGADPNSSSIKKNDNHKSDDNLTPVHIAAMWGNCCILEQLLYCGGNPWLQDSEHKDAFHMANEHEADECSSILKKYKKNKMCCSASKGENLSNDESNFKSLNGNASKSVMSNCCFVWSETHTLQNEGSNYLTAFEYKSASDKKESHCELQDSTQSEFQNESPGSHCSKTFKNFEWSLECVQKKVESSECVSVSNSVQASNETLNTGFLNLSLESGSSSITFPDTATNDCGEEVRVITDEKDDIILLETHCPPFVINKAIEESCSSNCSVRSDWRTFQSIEKNSSSSNSSTHTYPPVVIPPDMCKLENSEIFRQLKDLGDNPGPVLNYTRHIYLQRLAKLKCGLVPLCSLPKPKYPPEIYLYLEGKLDMNYVKSLDKKVSEEFDFPVAPHAWREGNQRCSFNYLLLDPRVTKNLPARVHLLNQEEKFHTFIDALFYIGKGTRARPFSHLYEAARLLNVSKQPNDKICHILDIWSSGLGVISLHCFHNSIPVEAYTHEACMVDSIGLGNLTNIKKGNYYGLCSKWTMSKKRQLGVLYISRALEIFIQEGERLIRPKDVQT